MAALGQDIITGGCSMLLVSVHLRRRRPPSWQINKSSAESLVAMTHASRETTTPFIGRYMLGSSVGHGGSARAAPRPSLCLQLVRMPARWEGACRCSVAEVTRLATPIARVGLTTETNWPKLALAGSCTWSTAASAPGTRHRCIIPHGAQQAMGQAPTGLRTQVYRTRLQR